MSFVEIVPEDLARSTGGAGGKLGIPKLQGLIRNAVGQAAELLEGKQSLTEGELNHVRTLIARARKHSDGIEEVYAISRKNF